MTTQDSGDVVKLTHTRSGNVCKGLYCEECVTEFALFGETFHTVERRPLAGP